jgi:hypothetical protein
VHVYNVRADCAVYVLIVKRIVSTGHLLLLLIEIKIVFLLQQDVETSPTTTAKTAGATGKHAGKYYLVETGNW